MRRFFDFPGVFALTVVCGPIILLCIAATLFGWW